MKTESKSQHIHSKCYLRGFTDLEDEDSKFCVFRLKERKILKNQDPKNFEKYRHFNTMEIQGNDSYSLEKSLSVLESEFSLAVQSIKTTKEFTGQNKESVLTMACLFFVRNLKMRQKYQNLIDLSMKHMASLAFQQPIGTIVNGIEITTDHKIALQCLDDIEVQLSNNDYILTELQTAIKIAPCFFQRKWYMCISDDNDFFITSDAPVLLKWQDKIDYLRENLVSPGLGMLNTEIVFPLTKNIVLIGTYEGKDKIIKANSSLVSKINTNSILFAANHLYSPQPKFSFELAGLEPANFNSEIWFGIDKIKSIAAYQASQNITLAIA